MVHQVRNYGAEIFFDKN